MKTADFEAIDKLSREILDAELGPGGHETYSRLLDDAAAAYVASDPGICPVRPRWNFCWTARLDPYLLTLIGAYPGDRAVPNRVPLGWSIRAALADFDRATAAATAARAARFAATTRP